MNGSSHAVLATINRNSFVITINRSDHGVIAENLVTLHGQSTKLEALASVNERHKLIGTDASHFFSVSLSKNRISYGLEYLN